MTAFFPRNLSTTKKLVTRIQSPRKSVSNSPRSALKRIDQKSPNTRRRLQRAESTEIGTPMRREAEDAAVKAEAVEQVVPGFTTHTFSRMFQKHPENIPAPPSLSASIVKGKTEMAILEVDIEAIVVTGEVSAVRHRISNSAIHVIRNANKEYVDSTTSHLEANPMIVDHTLQKDRMRL